MRTLVFALVAFIMSTTVVFAHAPVLTIDSVGALEYATFPQVYNVTGVIAHNPLSSIKNLTLWVNGATSTVIVDPYPLSTATTSPFSLPWNITAPGTYTLFVTAKHGTTGSTGTSTSETVSVTQTVIVPPPPPPVEEPPVEEPPVTVTECPAAPSYAAHYLKSLGIKAGGKPYKNMVSAVAGHMGPQTRFNGVDACTMPAYEQAVKIFIDGLVD